MKLRHFYWVIYVFVSVYVPDDFHLLDDKFSEHEHVVSKFNHICLSESQLFKDERVVLERLAVELTVLQ